MHRSKHERDRPGFLPPTTAVGIASDHASSDDPAVLTTTDLFHQTAVAEILGCCLTDLVVKQQRPIWPLSRITGVGIGAWALP